MCAGDVNIPDASDTPASTRGGIVAEKYELRFFFARFETSIPSPRATAKYRRIIDR
jgi:hypothetical protein